MSISKKEDPKILLFLFFFSGYRDRKLISYGDRGIEALPPESEGP